MSTYPFNNWQTPVFRPTGNLISGITNSNPAIVTTTYNHNYITGTIVRIDIPTGYGMQQINQQTGTITVTGNTTFTINIDTTQYDPYTVPSSWPYNEQLAYVSPIGEDNSILTAATINVLNPNHP